ncbi:MAG: ABC transporter ATP-binding protein [Bacteroidetes bacterium]|nr:ABC transporter ATP-binding protein [Bacteroidota bacterium]MBU1423749.1 ABC transporter ATP-binding protein [Bacteroidota bacterium]MBU2636502.1 ABC transporter ATP-binding protein [Bacteroidota bacterium]
MKTNIKIEAINIKKVFNRTTVFSNISFILEEGSALAIAGKNGSGKSTLAKIIAGVLTPNAGEFIFSINDKEIALVNRFKYLGFVSPYLQLYEEFTALENIQIYSGVRKLNFNNKNLSSLFTKVGLFDRKGDPVRTYSSGMKQRLKYAFALLHQPPLLILDEPRSNLDSDGISIVYDIVKEQKQKGSVIIATNDKEDLQYCDSIIDLNVKVNNSNK